MGAVASCNASPDGNDVIALTTIQPELHPHRHVIGAHRASSNRRATLLSDTFPVAADPTRDVPQPPPVVEHSSNDVARESPNHDRGATDERGGKDNLSASHGSVSGGDRSLLAVSHRSSKGHRVCRHSFSTPTQVTNYSGSSTHFTSVLAHDSWTAHDNQQYYQKIVTLNSPCEVLPKRSELSNDSCGAFGPFLDEKPQISAH